MSKAQQASKHSRTKIERRPNERLKAQRLKKNWTQVYVATMIGSSDVEVSRWETGVAEPSLYFREKLCELFGTSSEALGFFSEADAVQEKHLVEPSSALPFPLTSLIGREQEVTKVCTLLSQAGVRLLTLTGPGGVGKTRLALQIASEVQHDFADGVCFVSLAPLHDTMLVVPTISRTLGLQLQGSKARSPVEHLRAYLRDKHLLLVLDNFEHLLEAAPSLIELLAACPHLKLLVTSRTVLDMRGERVFTLQPLALPDSQHPSEKEVALRSGAVALFLERAREIHPTLELTEKHISLIVEICRRVDGLPLAIELAAARLKLLSLEELLERLEHRLTLLTGGSRDLPTRQQTLRNTLVWSYELLTGEEQRLFRLLAVFAGGCTLEAVESMYCALNGVNASVLDGITSLLNKHLVYRSAQEDTWARLMMLETIREFGWESLAANDELEQTSSAHATYYLQLAEGAERHLFGIERVPWFNRLEQEHDNLRAALHWLLDQANSEEPRQRKEMAARLATALVHFWASRGYVSEGHMWLGKILKEAKSSTRVSLRAKALSAAGMLATISGEYDRAAFLYTESLKLYQEGGDAQGRTLAQQWLGWITLRKQGDVQRARSLLEESSTFFRKMGDKTNLAYSLHFLAGVAIDQGQYAEAHTLLTEGLALFREMRYQEGISWSLRFQGRFLFDQGDQEDASALMEESLRLSREVNYQLGMAYALDLLGRFALAQRESSKAWSLLQESLVRLRKVEGVQQSTAYVLSHLAIIATMQGDNAQAASWYEESLMLFRQVNDLHGLAFCLQGWGALVARQGKLMRAARLWGAAEVLREVRPGAAFLLPIVPADIERVIATARLELGEHAFVTAWAEGRTMTPEQALALA